MNSSKRALVALLCFSVFTPFLHAQQLAFPEFLTFRLDGAALKPDFSKAYDAGIDQTLYIEWDEPLFSRQIALARGLLAQDEPLLARIRFLEDLTRHFLRTQEHLLQLKTAASRLETAKTTGEDSVTVARLRTAMHQASDRFAQAGQAGLQLVLDAARTLQGSEGQALAEELRARLNEAVLIGFDEMANVTGTFLSEQLADLNQELSRRLQNGEQIQVFMEAWLGARGRPLHLDGYDKLATGRPTPFARFQLALPERTTQELEAAKRLGDLVAEADVLVAEVQSALSALQQEIAIALEVLKLEVLQGNLPQLQQDLRGLGDVAAAPLLTEVRRMLELIETLIQVSGTGISDGSVDFGRLLGDAQRQIDAILTNLLLLPQNLQNLAAGLEATLAAFPDLVADETIHTLRQTAAALEARPEMRQAMKRIEEVRAVLGITGRIAAQAGQTGAIGRAVAPENSLDTSLALLTAGERHPGDLLVISARVVAQNGTGEEVVLASAHQRFRLRVTGFYVEPRGALFFVDPQDGEFGNQNFEPAVALGFVGHLGLRNCNFWNDFLNPGLGLSFTLLDFEEGRDFELGISGTATMLKDLLWVGYGRNLQAEVNFFSIGINPLAIGDFLSGKGRPF